MTWARFDDQYPFNPKVLVLSDKAFRADVSGICYAAAHLTNGRLDKAALILLRITPKVARELVAAGRWDEIGGGCYQIHDYLTYNPSREKVQSDRRRDAERKRGGIPPASDADSEPDSTPESERPGPSRPVPDPEVLPLASQNGSSGDGGPGEGSPADWIELVPPAIEDGQVRYLLGKFAASAPEWGKALTWQQNPYTLVALHLDHPGAFLEALQRADDLGPGTIDNPVGWLRSMVGKLEEGR